MAHRACYCVGMVTRAPLRLAAAVVLIAGTLGVDSGRAAATPLPEHVTPAEIPSHLLHVSDAPDLTLAIERTLAAQWEAELAAWYAWELETWLAAEREAWYAAERANAAAAAARARSTTSGYPALTPSGLAAMIQCESGGSGRYQTNTGNSFHGAVQWLPSTWASAATRAGFGQWAYVPVEQIPADVQDSVTYFWWSVSNPAGQWPVCHRSALRAMGY